MSGPPSPTTNPPSPAAFPPSGVDALAPSAAPPSESVLPDERPPELPLPGLPDDTPPELPAPALPEPSPVELPLPAPVPPLAAPAVESVDDPPLLPVVPTPAPGEGLVLEEQAVKARLHEANAATRALRLIADDSDDETVAS